MSKTLGHEAALRDIGFPMPDTKLPNLFPSECGMLIGQLIIERAVAVIGSPNTGKSRLAQELGAKLTGGVGFSTLTLDAKRLGSLEEINRAHQKAADFAQSEGANGAILVDHADDLLPSEISADVDEARQGFLDYLIPKVGGLGQPGSTMVFVATQNRNIETPDGRSANVGSPIGAQFGDSQRFEFEGLLTMQGGIAMLMNHFAAPEARPSIESRVADLYGRKALTYGAVRRIIEGNDLDSTTSARPNRSRTGSGQREISLHDLQQLRGLLAKNGTQK